MTRPYQLWLAAEPLFRYVASYDPMKGGGFPTLDRLQEMVKGPIGSIIVNLLVAILILATSYLLARLTREMVVSKGMSQAAFLGRMARGAMVGLAAAFDLRELGISASLAFGVGSTQLARCEVGRMLRVIRGEEESE